MPARNSARPALRGPYLYVGGKKLSMYALGAATPLFSTWTKAVARAAFALDQRGNLCEANGNVKAAAIYAFDARDLELKRRLDGEGDGALVADRFGNLYVTNGAKIIVHAQGCIHQIGIIKKCGCGPLAFDQSGNLYAGAGTEIRIYAPGKNPGSLKFVRAIDHGINGTAGLTVGPTGSLFVSSGTSNASVSVFPPGAMKPNRRITKGLEYPGPLAVDSTGRLYVANEPVAPPDASGWVAIYAPGATRPMRYLRYGKRVAPRALAIDSSDNVYVATYGGGESMVHVYAPGAAQLLNSIVKGVDSPTALLIGSP